MSKEAVENVLNLQSTRILESDKKKLEEMHVVTLSMAKNKVSSKNGKPIEFYLALWDEISLIL